MRAAIYLRVSTAEQTTDNQRRELISKTATIVALVLTPAPIVEPPTGKI